jgi:predicted RNase H-like HicB family nuclease
MTAHNPFTEFSMRFEVEFDRQEDGRWIAEIARLPGAMAYGESQEKALAGVDAIALRVLADRMENQHESLKSSAEFACA